MASEVMEMPQAPVVRPAPRPQTSVGVRASGESHHGLRDRIGGLFKAGDKQGPSTQANLNKETGRGVVGAINTGEPKEIAGAIQYDRSADTREAAFAARDKHVAWGKTMGESVNDQTLANSYLESRIDAESKSNGGTGNSIDRDYAKKRIEAAYRARAVETETVKAARGTASEEAVEGEIQGEMLKLMTRDAKQELAGKLEAQKSPDQGLSDLAQGAASTEPAPSGMAAEDVPTTAEPADHPAESTEKTVSHGDEVESNAEESGKAARENLVNIEAKLRTTEAEINDLRKKGANLDIIRAKEAEMEGQLRFHKQYVDTFFPSKSAKADARASGTRDINDGQAESGDGKATRPAEATEPAATATAAEADASPPSTAETTKQIGQSLETARSARDAAEQALDTYTGNDLNEYRQLEQALRRTDSEYRGLQAERDSALTEQRLSRMEADISRLVASNRELQDVVRSMANYVKEEDPEKKKALAKILIEVIGAIGLSSVLEAADEVKSSANTSS